MQTYFGWMQTISEKELRCGTSMDEKYKYAQLAAFVDGEGTIGVYKHKQYWGYSYIQTLIVTNSDIRLITWLIDNFGGKYPKPKKYENKNWKDGYQWQLTGKNSYKLLKDIREHLLLKREQADCAIDLYEKISRWRYSGSSPMPKHKKELSEELYQKCKKLNKTGRLDEEDKLEIKITIKKKDRTWDDYEITSENEEAEEE